MVLVELVWTPEQRIKHSLPQVRWPTADQAAASMLFSAVDIGTVRARHRTWVPAMVPWRATEDGFVTDAVVDWYRRFARGKPGVLVVEATGIRDIPSGPLLRIGHERFVPGLRRLVDAVREASEGETLLFIQVIDFLAIRRRPARHKFLAHYLEITDGHRRALGVDSDAQVREGLLGLDDDGLAGVLTERELEALENGYRERVWDTQLPHIADLPRVLPGLFGGAATRAFDAGFDGVELHYAHAYTMASFLSAHNTRDDGYGGPRENRVRLPVEIIAEVRRRIGDKPLGARFLGDEVIEGGNRIDDAVYFGGELARAGLDYLSVSKGGKFEDAQQPKVGWAVYPYTGRSGYECMPTVYSDGRGPFSRNVSLSAAIRAAVSVPVVTSGGIGTFEEAEAILQRGDADIIGAARASLADPDWFLKARLGHGDDVRRCEYTNYCEALDQKHKQVTCKLWDRGELDEPGVVLDATGRRRLTAPGWPRAT